MPTADLPLFYRPGTKETFFPPQTSLETLLPGPRGVFFLLLFRSFGLPVSALDQA